ncbi:hypothetical protein DFH94DRAFT_846875 [Russula ochroleuca]|uniref:Uncharacterized protein n=1 Tax=Russula ochroleuca TaxID=152965 RepID=A0A9P5K0Z9_9AGAM|nr:hypothetical protein DFH94DRAFT_846875 [Russula ochroleuca]
MHVAVITIDTFPDEVLLAIFDFCVTPATKGLLSFTKKEIEAWQSLVHRTPVRDMLDIWPALPFVIWDQHGLEQNFDNIMALLEHRDRDRLEKISAAMEGPFPEPELTDLYIWTYIDLVPVLPDSFLAGPAPRLRTLRLDHFLFPGLPKLLLSTTHLVYFSLRIPHSEQFSPKAMFTALTTLTSLESLNFEIQHPRRSYADRASQSSPGAPPTTRSVLPALTFLSIKGESKYLEDLVVRIDAPQLSRLYITFFKQIAYDTPQLAQFICRTPRLKTLEKAYVTINSHEVGIYLSSQTSGDRELGDQFGFSTLKNTPWLELLHRFTAVKDLYLSKEFALSIVPALQELVGERTTEVLPTLQNIFLEGFQSSGLIYEGIGQFVAARQVTTRRLAGASGDERSVEVEPSESPEAVPKPLARVRPDRELPSLDVIQQQATFAEHEDMPALIHQQFLPHKSEQMVIANEYILGLFAKAYVELIQRKEREPRHPSREERVGLMVCAQWSGANDVEDLISHQGRLSSTAAMAKGVTEVQFPKTKSIANYVLSVVTFPNNAGCCAAYICSYKTKNVTLAKCPLRVRDYLTNDELEG